MDYKTMTEEEFYIKKIFQKVGIVQLKKQYPSQAIAIKQWYKSERFNIIQRRRSMLKTKLNILKEDGESVNLNDDQLYLLFKWWDKEPKKCFYCSITQNALDELNTQAGHINKRYPKRGKSLEIDRRRSDIPYSNVRNLVLACYWCNNAKTDTFSEHEFLQIGKIIKDIWEQRLGYKLSSE